MALVAIQASTDAHFSGTRFHGAQFIEGLFTNVNVQFRTIFKYVVERTAQQSASSLYNAVDRVEQQ
ncbi:hypothetical protein BGY98DRAFT_990857, partial [Russula aff. rugulosa BPL654]